MGDLPLVRVFITLLALLLLGSCTAGKSQNLPQQYADAYLACLTPLKSYCCGSKPALPCVGDFSSAERCASWPAGTSVRVFSSPCQGLTAVRVDTTYSSFYVYDASGALLAVGDNAATPDPQSGAIGCGAGPSDFGIPGACADVWEASTTGAACAGGASAPTSVCP